MHEEWGVIRGTKRSDLLVGWLQLKECKPVCFEVYIVWNKTNLSTTLSYYKISLCRGKIYSSAAF